MSEENEDVDLTENQEEPSKKRISRRKVGYTISLKRKVIECALGNTISYAAKKYMVPRSCVQDWIKKKEKLGDEKRSEMANMRLKGAGRPLKDSEFDNKLVAWIREQRKLKIRVSRRIIQNQAKLISSESEFKASNGWLERFLSRHDLAVRRPTTVCQKPPQDFMDKIVDFVLFVEKKRYQNNYDHIYACAETSVQLDFSNTLTVDVKGAREVSVKSTGHDKLNITVMLCAREDGFKCRPFVLMPNKRPVLNIMRKFGGQLELCWAGRSFFDDALTTKFLESIIQPSLFGKRMLVWDSYKCHISADTKATLKKLKVDVAVIPGGTTKFLQAPDVYWNFVFKSKIRAQYEDYMLNGEKSYTASGNMRPPPMDVYLSWILKSWKELPEDLIKRSFKGCALTLGPNGVDDEEIHCFKSEGSLVGGVEILRKAREDRQAAEELEDMMEDFDIESGDLSSDLSFDN